MKIRLYAASALVAAGVLCAAETKARRFEVDLAWPKPLPNKLVLGQVSGVFVNAQDHVVIVNRRDNSKRLPLSLIGCRPTGINGSDYNYTDAR